MALTQLNQLAIAFKKLAGKAHTNSSFGIGNEAIPSLLQVGTGTIFGEPIPSTGLPSSLYGINGTVEKIEFQLTEISAAQYLASNPGGLSGATINASGDGAPAGTFLNGIHAYKLSLPSDYESNSSNPKRGTAPFTNGSVVPDSNGGLQIIPDSFAAGYAAVVYDGTSVIFPGDQDDYYLDYSTGILFIQDIVSGQPPVKVEAYLYIGKYLADSTLSYSGSFSGSFQGDGAGLTNVPASGVVGLNLTQIATSDVTASVQNSSNIFTVTSASQEVFNITDQGILSGSGANLFDIPASGITGLNLSRVATGSVTASVNVGATPFLVESGSSTLMSVTPVGKIAVSKSINVGTPSSSPWGVNLEGSYFNNFSSTSDVSDILRFIAGILSSSAPDASPNTKTWLSTNIDFNTGSFGSKTSYMTGVLAGLTNARLSQEWNQSNAINLALTGSYRRLQTYLIDKGWLGNNETGSNVLHDVGTHPFGISTYGVNIPTNIYNTFTTFTFNADSVNTGTTTFSSSIGPTAFGLGRLLTPTTVNPLSISISTTQSFSNTASIATPGVTSTFSTSSLTTYTLSTAGTSNGLSLGIINTGNSLIDNTFQDGRFLDTPAGYQGRKWDNSDTDRITGNTTSSIGYYRIHGIDVKLSTGSSQPISRNLNTSDTTGLYYMPSLGTLGVTNITTTPPSVTILGTSNIFSFSATSASISGAPYLLTTTYTIRYNTEVSKSFDPCYGASTTPIAVNNPTNEWSSRGTTNLTGTTVSVTFNGVQTSSSIAGVFPAGTNPLSSRTLNATPAIGDVSFLSSSFTFSLTSNSSNVIQNRITQRDTNYGLTFRTTGTNWVGDSSTLTSNTINLYTSSLFGQPSTSGSMAIYSYGQGYDPTSNTSLTESFDGEANRIQLNDNVTTFTGDTWSTSFGLYNLGTKDLQVKPKFLVRPGGVNGYWLTDPDPLETYKYYIRKFRRTDALTSFTFNPKSTLLQWSNTSDTGVAVVFIFESGKTGATIPPAFGGGTIPRCRIFDPRQNNGPVPIGGSNTITGNTPGLNPFSVSIDYYGAGGNSDLATSFPFVTQGGNGIIMDGSSAYDEFYVLVRYTNDANPLTSFSI